MISILKVRVLIAVEPDDDAFYAYCPELQGVHVSGESETDAIENAKDAAIAYLSSVIKNEEPLPLCVKKHQVTLGSIGTKSV